MKLMDLHEGMMKRSDPYVSGERSGPRPPDAAESPHAKKINALAKSANVAPSVVAKLWDDAVAQIDKNEPRRWAIAMVKIKRKLGI